MVKIYALSTCPWCKKMKKHLNDKGLDYECVDVDQVSGSEQEQALQEVDELVDKRKFPVVVVEDTVIQGYKPEEVDQALEEK